MALAATVAIAGFGTVRRQEHLRSKNSSHRSRARMAPQVTSASVARSALCERHPLAQAAEVEPEKCPGNDLAFGSQAPNATS